MALLPIRARALHYLAGVDKADATQVMAGLKSEYGSERQFTKENFLDHLMALKANGLVDEVNYDTDSQGELRIYYRINDEGRETINKFLPKKWRTA